jgi:hypothetical protein
MVLPTPNQIARLLCLCAVFFWTSCDSKEDISPQDTHLIPGLPVAVGQTNEEAFLKQYAKEKQENIKLLNTAYREPLGKFRASVWHDVFLPLYLSGVRTSGSCMVEACHAKKAEYYLPFSELMTFSANVTIFVTHRGQVWAGPEQQFYIETDSGVVGGRFKGGDILWCDSLIKRDSSEEMTLKVALERWKQEVGRSKLEEANGWHLTPECIRKRVTELLTTFLSAMFFSVAPNAGGEELCGIEVEGRLVRLDFRRAGDASIGSAWINIKSRKLQKATAYGKQVYPK